MRFLVVPLLLIGFVGVAASFLFPWDQPTGPTAEADDGEHLWGRNVYDRSTFVYQIDAPLRQIAFPLAVGAASFSALALAFGIGDRRAGALTFTWLGLLAMGGAGTLFMIEVVDAGFRSPGLGLFAAGGGVLALLLSGMLGIGLGSARREAYLRSVYGD